MTPGAEIDLRIERDLDHSPERVWDAWTRPEALARWFAPDPSWDVRVERHELREGGAWRIDMHGDDGTPHVFSGRFVEIAPPRRLAFTWTPDGSDPPEETLVTIHIEPRGARTRLKLVHERFASAESRDLHAQGWEGCLARLPAALETQ